MADRMMGIVRYSREILKAMDQLLRSEDKVTLLLPPNAVDVPEYKNIRIFVYGKHKGIKWEQIDLSRYMRKTPDSVCINLCNVAPFFIRPGITVVHDIMYRVNPSHYTSLRNRISRYWHMLQYSYIARHEKVIATVSKFSQSEIEKNYPAAKGKTVVIPNAWQHVLEYTPSNTWEERYSQLKKREYFFSLATLSKNKNGKWIVEAAKKNKECIFAIAGKHYETDNLEIPSNVYLLGFVSDEDACALIQNCKAFVFPSIYEGFGLPPLEALALGAVVISSNAASLPEVLGNSVHYIDPLDASIDLQNKLEESIDIPERVLDRFSWRRSAELLLNVMHDFKID